MYQMFPTSNKYLTHMASKSGPYFSQDDIALVKMNQKGKKPSDSLTCRFCANDLPETQEHLEMCEGTKFERRGVRISEVMGRVIRRLLQ